MTRCGGGVCVHVEAKYVERTRVVTGEAPDNRRDSGTRRAPWRPEVNQGQALGGQCLIVEVRGRERGYRRRGGQLRISTGMPTTTYW